MKTHRRAKNAGLIEVSQMDEDCCLTKHTSDAGDDRANESLILRQIAA